jgi:hypothetical protein
MVSKERLDVLDLLIDVIREHERRMDELVTQLEKVVQTSYKLGFEDGLRSNSFELTLKYEDQAI